MNFLTNNKKLKDELEIFADIKENIDLKDYNTFRISSVCDLLVEPKEKGNIKNIINILKKFNKKFVVLGNGSNVIFKNKKTKKVIVLLSKLNKIKIEGTFVKAESGVLLPILVKETLNNSLLGLENFINIPGTVGGSVYGNAGCYGKEISESIFEVEVLKDNEFITLKRNELYFSYRDSIFKREKNMIILSTTFGLTYGNKERVLEEIRERNSKRLESQPLEYPSAGSVFRNPEGNYSGALIEKMGFKGYKVGGASVSEKHANFIINEGNATGKDVLKIIDDIKKKAKKVYNIDLVLEHIIID